MNKKTFKNLHFLWRENYISYLWASNVTALVYFLHSGVLIFENEVLSAYATTSELKEVEIHTNHLVDHPEDILKLEEKFNAVKQNIKNIASSYSARNIKNSPNRALYVLILNLFEVFREYISVYKYTEPHYVRHIEKTALEIVRSKMSANSPEKALAGELAKGNFLYNKDYRFSKKEIDLFSLLQMTAKMRLRAKTIDAPLLGYDERITREIAKRTFVSVNQVSSLNLVELKKILVSGREPKMPVVNERQHHFAVDIKLSRKNRVKNFSNKELNKLLEYNRGNTKSTVLYGSIGYPGDISGNARVVPPLFAPREFKKFIDSLKKTDVLIAPMTSPKITFAFPRIAAVVTDEGGLMSHAALVARERKIPCIVGTEMATRIFKDGDRIRVDANNGKVMKLE